MGLENWLHEQIDKLARNDKEYLIVFTGLAVIAMFLYAVIS